MNKNPIIITGTAGSGTRVFCEILELLGVHMGTNQNPYKDNKWFIEIIKDGVPITDPDNLTNDCYLASISSPDFDVEQIDSTQQQHVRNQVETFKRIMLSDIPTQTAKWGWKESQSMFVLPFLHEAFPEMSIIHVVRDGRDIAFSKQQRAKYQVSYVQVLNKKYDIHPDDYLWPVYVAKAWEHANIGLATWAKNNLNEGNYMCMPLEALYDQKEKVINNLISFLCLSNHKAERVLSQSGFHVGNLRLLKFKKQDPELITLIENKIAKGLSWFKSI